MTSHKLYNVTMNLKNKNADYELGLIYIYIYIYKSTLLHFVKVLITSDVRRAFDICYACLSQINDFYWKEERNPTFKTNLKSLYAQWIKNG